jgi:hypothetical protein
MHSRLDSSGSRFWTPLRALLVPAFLTALAFGAPVPPEKPDPLKEAIDLGPLEEYFKLVSVERVVDPNRGSSITLKLQAKKDVDTSQCFCKVGFFDKGRHMHLASPLRFEAAFPLLKGESINATCGEGRTPQEWHKIAVRKIDKPVPRSEYHYQ